MPNPLLCCCAGQYEGCSHGRGLASCSEPVDEGRSNYWCKGCDARRCAHIKLARICACGHAVSEHIDLPASDGTPLLLCMITPDCGDTGTSGDYLSRCSVPPEVID